MTTGKGIALVILIGHAMILSTHMVEAVGIKIAAYNVRIFGTSKLQNQVAMNMITQVDLRNTTHILATGGRYYIIIL